MDMSFANQALAAEMIARSKERLSIAVHRVPEDLDREDARLKLQTMAVALQVFTPEQERYLNSWREGTLGAAVPSCFNQTPGPLPVPLHMVDPGLHVGRGL